MIEHPVPALQVNAPRPYWRSLLYEKHALKMPPERVRENVAAQLQDFDGYNARPISGA
jgi:hypothetical protein